MFRITLILLLIIWGGAIAQAQDKLDYNKIQTPSQQQIDLNFNLQSATADSQYFYLMGAQVGHFVIEKQPLENFELTIINPENVKYDKVDLKKNFTFLGYGKYQFILKYKDKKINPAEVKLKINFKSL